MAHLRNSSRNSPRKTEARFEQLDDSKDLFGLVTEASPAIVWITDSNGQTIFLNKKWKELTGRDVNGDLGTGWVQAVHPDDRETAAADLERSMQERGHFKRELRFVTASGEYRWFESHGTARFDPNGNFGGFLGICLDIHERKISEQALREGHNFLRAVLDSLPVALFCKDAEADFSFTLWNRMSEVVFGIGKEQVLGKTDFDLFDKEQAGFFRRKDRETLAGNERVEIVEEPARDRLVHTYKVPVNDLTGKPRYLLGISEDITDRKRTEAKLIHASKMSTLGEMAGGIAHEVNNPLAIITLKTGQIRTLMKRGQLKPEQLEKDLEKIEHTAQRIAKIIKGLRAFSRNADHDPFEKVPLSQLFEDALELCKERFKTQGLELRVSPIPAETVECRPAQISQIILNLLNNSYDAVSGTDGNWVSLDVDVSDSMLVFSVTDSGNGIPDDVVGRMMQPFFTTKEVGRGTGLGLSIAKGLAEEHGGTLEYDRSSPNTRFMVRIPLRSRKQRRNS